MLQKQERIRNEVFGARVSEELLQPNPVVVLHFSELPNCKAVHRVDLTVLPQPLLLCRRDFRVPPGEHSAPPTAVHAPRGPRVTDTLRSEPPEPAPAASAR